MINGTEWLVVTKLDVLDELDEIPVCTGYKIDGKIIDKIPADVRGIESIEPIYTKLPGWNESPTAPPNTTSCPRSRRTTCASSKRNPAQKSA